MNPGPIDNQPLHHTGDSIQDGLKLNTLVEKLNRVLHKWFELGVQLEIDYSVLKHIAESRDGHNHQRCLIEILTYWKEGNTRHGIPRNLKPIIDALKTDSLGEKGLAMKLEEQLQVNESNEAKSQGKSESDCGEEEDKMEITESGMDQHSSGSTTTAIIETETDLSSDHKYQSKQRICNRIRCSNRRSKKLKRLQRLQSMYRSTCICCVIRRPAPNLKFRILRKLSSKMAVKKARKQSTNRAGLPTIKIASSKEAKRVITMFRKKWNDTQFSCPTKDEIPIVYSIQNEGSAKRWRNYRSSLKDQKAELFYHGTTLKCNKVKNKKLCTDQECGVCGIASRGFDERYIKNCLQRYGPGFYLAPNPAKCHAFTQGTRGCRAILVCDVCPGRKYYTEEEYHRFERPPKGYDSVYSTCNSEEIVLYNPGAILPKYIILYKKDKIPHCSESYNY